jgi:hypothetical protein
MNEFNISNHNAKDCKRSTIIYNLVDGILLIFPLTSVMIGIGHVKLQKSVYVLNVCLSCTMLGDIDFVNDTHCQRYTLGKNLEKGDPSEE